MKTPVRLRDRMRELCDEITPDDGVDPRQFQRQRARESRRKTDRKTLQLCGQVAKILTLALGDSTDELLSMLVVSSVEPAPNLSCLRVTVSSDPQQTGPPSALLQRLELATPWLRSEVSNGIHRKRTPRLLFDWRPT